MCTVQVLPELDIVGPLFRIESRSRLPMALQWRSSSFFAFSSQRRNEKGKRKKRTVEQEKCDDEFLRATYQILSRIFSGLLGRRGNNICHLVASSSSSSSFNTFENILQK